MKSHWQVATRKSDGARCYVWCWYNAAGELQVSCGRTPGPNRAEDFVLLGPPLDAAPACEPDNLGA